MSISKQTLLVLLRCQLSGLEASSVEYTLIKESHTQASAVPYDKSYIQAACCALW